MPVLSRWIGRLALARSALGHDDLGMEIVGAVLAVAALLLIVGIIAVVSSNTPGRA